MAGVVVAAVLLSVSAVAFAGREADLPGRIDAALSDPVLKHGIQGIVIRSLKDGRVLYEKNADTALLPASNLKLLVSATALDKLGPDFRFTTAAYTTAAPAGGTLKGDVVLVGKGDPVFDISDLQAMVDKLKQSGVAKLDGNVVVDDSRFDDIPFGWGWAWDDQSYYYAAQVSALNLNENVVDVSVRPALQVGGRPSVRLDPPTSYMVTRNESVTTEAGAEKALAVERARGRNTIIVKGTVPIDYKPTSAEESITMEDPALFTGRTFVEMARRAGIEVTGQEVRGKLPDGATLLASHDSPPLSELLARLNKPSDNLIAECLLKTLSAEANGKGTTAGGVRIELAFMEKAGLDMTALGIIDGSGLSRQNVISSRNLMTLLEHMYRHKHSRVFIDSLPVAAVDGTLKRRMAGTAAEGNVRAKTGYLNRVSTVSGYVTTKAGEPLVFSIVMNNHLCRNKEATAVQDSILVALAELDR